MVEDPDETFEVAPDRCAHCEQSLREAAETARVRHQVVDVDAPPPPKITEYQLVSRRCGGCGQLNDPTAIDVPRLVVPGLVLHFYYTRTIATKARESRSCHDVLRRADCTCRK